MAEGDDLYGPDWPARSRRIRTGRFTGRRKQCGRCWIRRCEEAHHMVRFGRRWAPLLDRVFLRALCDDCHDAVHAEDRRHPHAPLWVDTIRSYARRWWVNLAVLGVIVVGLWVGWSRLGGLHGSR